MSENDGKYHAYHNDGVSGFKRKYSVLQSNYHQRHAKAIKIFKGSEASHFFCFYGGSSLLYGQVAFSSTQQVRYADCILIANDNTYDDLRKTTIKMAKPPAVKLVIKNIADSIEAIKAALPG